MNRLSFVEVIESNRLRKNNLLFFLCLVLSPSFLFAQVERNSEKVLLNGFGTYIFVDNQYNLYNLFSYDVDGDGFVDIGGLDENGKNLIVYYGKGSNEFSTPIRYSIGGNFSGLLVKKLNLDNKTNLIVYSKVEGLIKIYSFIGRNITLVQNLKVDCCFQDLIAVNLDKSPQLEIVIYGSNFKGLGIISFKDYQYQYKRLEIGTFSKLVPFLLNSDDKVDFVGYNPLNRQIILLRNNSIYNYSKNVYRTFDEPIEEILVGNFDDDAINDLILISNTANTLFVLIGNSLGGFSKQYQIKTISKYSNTIVFDYNRDLNDDLIIYDRFAKKIYLKSFSQALSKIISYPLAEIEKFYSISGYRTTTTKGVVLSTNQGVFLVVYSSLSSSKQRYLLASNPSDLITHRLSDELYPRIIFIDRNSRRLNILSRNEFNSPQEVLSISISYAYERVKILKAEKNQLQLVCFKPLVYHFDFIMVDLKSGRYFRENLAVDGLIKDIGLEPSSQNQILISVLVHSKNEIRIINIRPFNINKIVLNELISDFNFLEYVFDFSTREFIFINKDITGDVIHIWSKKFDNTYKKYDLLKIRSIKNQNYLSYRISLCEFYADTKILILNLLGLKESILHLIPMDNSKNFFTLNNISISDINNCKCKEHTGLIENTFSFYNEKSRAFEKIVFSSKGKPMNILIKPGVSNTLYSIDYTLKHNAEIVYISNYSIINIERVKE